MPTGMPVLTNTKMRKKKKNNKKLNDRDKEDNARNESCTWHHALETAEVDVCAVVQQVKDLICVFLHLVLNVHLAALLVLLLT